MSLDEVRADSWKCYRCELVLPSPSEGKPPVTCLKELGGCGRSIDWEDEAGYTRFFPADWHPDKIGMYVEADLGRDGQEIFGRLVTELDRLIEFVDRWHAKMSALGVFASYLKDVLPAVFYIGFSGTHGTAKSTVTRILTDYSKNGIMAGSLTEASLARKMNQGCTLGIDEVDSLPKEVRAVVEAALREGYTPGTKFIRADKNKADVVHEYEIYGMKFLNFRRDMEEALMSRTYKIPMARVRENVADVVADNLMYMGDRLGRLPIKESIEKFCTHRLQKWDRARVRQWLDSPNTRERVRAIMGSSTGRDYQLAYICFLIGDIVGIELETFLREAVTGQEPYEDESSGEFVKYVKHLFEGDGRPPVLYRSKMRTEINKMLEAEGEKPLHHKAFGKALRDIGCREGHELKREGGKGRNIIVFTPELLTSLYPKDTSQDIKVASLLSFDASQSEGSDVKHPESSSEIVKYLRERCEAISSQKTPPSFTLDEILHEAPEWLTPDVAEKWVERWRNEGSCLEVRLGNYKLI